MIASDLIGRFFFFDLALYVKVNCNAKLPARRNAVQSKRMPFLNRAFDFDTMSDISGSSAGEIAPSLYLLSTLRSLLLLELLLPLLLLLLVLPPLLPLLLLRPLLLDIARSASAEPFHQVTGSDKATADKISDPCDMLIDQSLAESVSSGSSSCNMDGVLDQAAALRSPKAKTFRYTCSSACKAVRPSVSGCIRRKRTKFGKALCSKVCPAMWHQTVSDRDDKDSIARASATMESSFDLCIVFAPFLRVNFISANMQALSCFSIASNVVPLSPHKQKPCRCAWRLNLCPSLSLGTRRPSPVQTVCSFTQRSSCSCAPSRIVRHKRSQRAANDIFGGLHWRTTILPSTAGEDSLLPSGKGSPCHLIS